jgi:hypothetical protein
LHLVEVQPLEIGRPVHNAGHVHVGTGKGSLLWRRTMTGIVCFSPTSQLLGGAAWQNQKNL